MHSLFWAAFQCCKRGTNVTVDIQIVVSLFSQKKKTWEGRRFELSLTSKHSGQIRLLNQPALYVTPNSWPLKIKVQSSTEFSEWHQINTAAHSISIKLSSPSYLLMSYIVYIQVFTFDQSTYRHIRWHIANKGRMWKCPCPYPPSKQTM